jgi:shikimate dehydrogenase
MKDVYTFDDLTDWKYATAGENPPLRLAVIGDPVAHSASPQMHNAALAESGIDARYCRLHIRPDELDEALRLLWEKGFIGVNCTIPHKLNALANVDEADEDANRAGGVNTIVIGPGGRLTGSSTDGMGLVRAVKEQFDVELHDLRVLVLGAGGGAGRAVAKQCAFSGARRLILINRSPEKLQPLHDTIVETYSRERIFICAWDEPTLAAALDHADLVVNCSSLGMKPGDPSPIAAPLLSRNHLLYDTIYTADRTPLMLAADAAGARSANGLSMLLHQGALSFEKWFNRPAPLETMRKALHESVANRRE